MAEEKKKKKRKRRAYLDSFQMGDDGKYAYKGAQYAFVQKEKGLRRVLAELWAMGALLAAAVVAAGCVTAPGMDECFYLILPYTAEFVAAVSVCWGLARLTAGRDPLREYIYKATVEQIPLRAGFAAICAAAVLLAESIYLILNGTDGKTAGCIVFVALQGAALGLALLLRRRIRAEEWRKASRLDKAPQAAGK